MEETPGRVAILSPLLAVNLAGWSVGVGTQGGDEGAGPGLILQLSSLSGGPWGVMQGWGGWTSADPGALITVRAPPQTRDPRKLSFRLWLLISFYPFSRHPPQGDLGAHVLPNQGRGPSLWLVAGRRP